MSARLERAYRLPHGFTVEFRAELDRINPREFNPRGIICEWSPHIPHIRSARARRKFGAAYVTARNDFLQDVAQMTGETILAVDLDEQDRPFSTSAFKPQVAS